ncbi:carboxylesterase family protein [bacterium 210820-DFI.6.37]|nr:carboxylesterase family protein [bacterium 210820-DFI.6.37]
MKKKLFMMSCCLVLCLACLLVLAGCKEENETETNAALTEFDLGTVKGTVSTASDGTEVEVYKGIPFATFEKRFGASTLKTEDLGEFDASSFAPAPYQPTDSQEAAKNETDCLGLNIYVPETANKEDLPVYVWIYGGANITGSSDDPLYDFTNLASSGIVCVTFNYRVNSLGFSAFELDDGTLVSNAALSDMVNALQWVRNYIGAFGGDPDRVTIGGESAGAYNVSYLLTSAKAKGLFSQAIMESGGDLGWSKQQGLSVTKNFSDFFSGKQVKSSQEAYEILSGGEPYDVAKWSYDSMNDSSMFYLLDAYGLQDGSYLPENADQKVKKSDINPVKLMVGQNANEYTMYLYEDMTMTYFDKLIESYFGEDYISAFRDYFKLSEKSSEEEIRNAITDLGNVCFLYDSYFLLDAQAKAGMDTYCYYYQYLSGDEAAYHGSELPLVYKTDTDEAASQVSDLMFNAWVNFIKYGDPNGKDGSELAVKWPGYTADEKQVLYFDEESKAGDFSQKEKETVHFILETLYDYSF